MTQQQAIRAYYRWLHNGNRASVRDCSMYGHPLWPYRTGRITKPLDDGRREPDIRTGADYRFDKPMEQSKAIRQTCLDCAETSSDVRDCRFHDCALWQYRMGRVVLAPDGAVSDINADHAMPTFTNRAIIQNRRISDAEKEPHLEPAETN